MDAYEAKNQELMAENTDLRALLRSMQVYVTILLMLLRLRLPFWVSITALPSMGFYIR